MHLKFNKKQVRFSALIFIVFFFFVSTAFFFFNKVNKVEAQSSGLPVVTTPSSTLNRIPTVVQGTQIIIRWNAVAGSTNYLLRIDDRQGNSLVSSWNGSCSAPNAGDVCATIAPSQTSYTFNGAIGHSYSLWMHNVDSNGVASSSYATMYFTMVTPNSIPNCSNVSWPSSLIAGYPYTFTATHTSAQGNLAGYINIMRNSDKVVVAQSPLKYFATSATSGTTSFTWTPTVAGDYTAYCGSVNSTIAECRGEDDKVDRPPRFVCAGPGATRTTTVVPNSLPNSDVVSINGSNAVTPYPVTPDGTKTYTVKLFSTDPTGGATIAEQLILLNYQGVNAGQYRDYFGWSNQGFKYFSSTTQLINCANGGQAAINNSSTYGAGKYITLHSCSTTASGSQRITTFVISFNPAFTKPSSNYFSAYTEDDRGATKGWKLFGSISLDLPKFGMTVPSQYAVSGQASNVEKIAASYPGFPYLSDWWNGNDAAGIISNKCNLPEYIPMIYGTNSAEPPAACDDGRPLILGNECELSSQCNSTEDAEYAMWQRLRTWSGPVIFCNNFTGVPNGLTRCANLLARYKTQYGSFPPNSYLGIHTYGVYHQVGSDYQYTLATGTITSYYNLSIQYNLKRYVGEWGFMYEDDTNVGDLPPYVVRDMDKLVGNIMTSYDPDIMMYFTTREVDNPAFTMDTLFNSNGTKTSVGTRYFNLYY